MRRKTDGSSPTGELRFTGRKITGNPADIDLTRRRLIQAYAVLGGALLREQPASNFVSLRAGVAPDNLTVSLFADNVLDASPQLTYTHEDRHTLLFSSTTFRPRTIGVTATYDWH